MGFYLNYPDKKRHKSEINNAIEHMLIANFSGILPFQYEGVISNKLKTIISWGELNLQGMFFIGAYLHYFEFEEDMVKFILQWG